MTEKKGFWENNWKYIVICVSALCFSIFYLIPPFNADIPNYDSTYQYFLTRHDFAEIWELLPADFSPPLYTLLLKLWTMIFGDTLAVMRAFALVPLCGMYFLAAFPIRKAFGGKASVLCTVFFALSSVNFIIVPEIRPATLSYFFVTAAAIYSYIALFFDSRYAYICFTVFSILAMYTHNIGMLAALMFYISAFFVALAQKKYRHVIKFLISGAISAVCYIPWLFVVIQQFGNVKNHYWSKSFSTVSQIYDWTISVNFDDGGSNLLGIAIIPVAALIAIVSVLSVKSNREKLKGVKTLSGFGELTFGRFKEPVAKTIYVILLFITPILAVILFSLIVHPIIVPRYFYIFCGTGLMMIAAGFSQFSGKIGTLVLSVLVAVSFSLHSVSLSNELETADFPEMVEYIRNSAPENEISFIHTHEWSLGIMMYYFPEANHYIFDETWCVLTTYDVFPTEIINVGNCEEMYQYENDFFIFAGSFPDADISLNQVYESSDLYNVDTIGMFSEPYTYKQKWRLMHVTTKD